jgi:hypothetical protein
MCTRVKCKLSTSCERLIERGSKNAQGREKEIGWKNDCVGLIKVPTYHIIVGFQLRSGYGYVVAAWWWLCNGF